MGYHNEEDIHQSKGFVQMKKGLKNDLKLFWKTYVWTLKSDYQEFKEGFKSKPKENEKKEGAGVEIAVFLMGAFIANSIGYFTTGNMIYSTIVGLFGGILSLYFYSMTTKKKKE